MKTQTEMLKKLFSDRAEITGTTENEVREKLREGVEILANAVKITMGPKGKIVLIERKRVINNNSSKS